ncbi:hypothetical protein AVEN_123619-1 [Araneus ventricosus]|uniref:Uncharacterized protein n=1 Tax=Araneus ventricosus TaxID=182803 RepID=A0A4Y2WD13_ARAVE|nr:hypothetical protein AVEN_193628-1 [Araneus ventricosus]GBO35246.1 hypothetical protein AVEN_123619-1 [Araneus ventricosus]
MTGNRYHGFRDCNPAPISIRSDPAGFPSIRPDPTGSGRIGHIKTILPFHSKINCMKDDKTSNDAGSAGLPDPFSGLQSLHGLGRGGLVVRSRLWGRRVPGSRPDSTEDPPCMGPVAR